MSLAEYNAKRAAEKLPEEERRRRHKLSKLHWQTNNPEKYKVGVQRRNKRAWQRRKRKRQERRYARAWRAAHPTYHADWRRSHFEQERERQRRWKQTPKGIEARRQQDRRRRRSQSFELPALFVGHPFLEAARALVGRAWYGEKLYDASKEDEAGEAVLAMLEGRDPKAAIHAYRRSEYVWKLHRAAIPDNF